MFKFFKRASRADGPASKPVPRARTFSDQESVPTPLPEVIEGDGDTDWSLWQESVNHMDSQLQTLPGFTTTEAQDIDAFAKVRKTDK